MNYSDIDLLRLLKRLALPTVAKLLPELELRAASEGLSHRDFLAILIAEEVAHRDQTRVQRETRAAKFPFLKSYEQFDFTFQSSIKRSLLGPYLGPELISEGRCLILSGKPGRGKTHLAIAIAYRAIQNGFSARFVTACDLIDELSAASKKGRLREATTTFVQPDVLVVDEVGYLHHADDAANVLYGIIDRRCQKRKPLIFTTNKPLSQWGVVLHDHELAEAILDRVLERGSHIELKGLSHRTKSLEPFQETGPTSSSLPS